MDQKSTREFSVAVIGKMKKDLNTYDPKKIMELVKRIEGYIEFIKMANSVEKKPKKKAALKKKKRSLPDEAPGTPGKSSDASA